jgi:hypothetical protein
MHLCGARTVKCLSVLLGLMATIGVVWVGSRFIPVSQVYSVRAEFDTLPPNDRELERWLRSQKGVLSHTVCVERHGQTLRVIWIMTQSMNGSPPTPELERAWERLRYVNASNVDWHHVDE